MQTMVSRALYYGASCEMGCERRWLLFSAIEIMDDVVDVKIMNFAVSVELFHKKWPAVLVVK